MSNTLCSFVFAHTDIEPNGDIKFCCAAEAGLHKDPQGRVYNVNTHTLKEAWNSDLLKQTRLQMIRGERPEVCNYCWSMENNDNTQGASVRLQAANRRIFLNDITDRINYAEQHQGELEDLAFDFQISIGNLCNFACKMCNPGFSTQYQKFFARFHDDNSQVRFVDNVHTYPNKHFEFPFGTAFDWPITQDLMRIFGDHVKTVKRIFFTGGEPTLIPQVTDFIENLAKQGRTNDLVIWPSTNCSNINTRLLSTLEPFSEVWLNISLDGMGDIAYLQRTPSNWASIEGNVDKLFAWIQSQRQQGKIINPTLISTVTALNLHHILDFWQYFEERYGKISNYGIAVNLVLHRDTNLGIEIVPKTVAEQLLAQIKDIMPNCSSNIKDGINQLHDILTNTNFAMDSQAMHYCLDRLQFYHCDYDIKQIYSIYYS